MILMRGLTPHTMKSYHTYISAYLTFVLEFLHKIPEQVTYVEIRMFLTNLQKERSLSNRTINTAISQIRFLTVYVLHRPWDPTQVPMRKFDTFLPYVPSQEDVKIFISTMTDIKAKAMVVVMYSAGLRVGEVCKLRYDDVSRKNMRIHVTHGKNRSDRYATLSKYALDTLTAYWRKCGRPKGYLFPKQTDPNNPISPNYLSGHIHKHEKALGWPKRLTCHSFRHAFGTHLYENGADLMTIKTLLGHKSLNSTMIYVHLAIGKKTAVFNPLDKLMLGDVHE